MSKFSEQRILNRVQISAELKRHHFANPIYLTEYKNKIFTIIFTQYCEKQIVKYIKVFIVLQVLKPFIV